MPKQKRSDDWGFPRWRSYGDKGRHAAKVRLCDREGCNEVGDRPAPKAPHSRERWYFCEAHAAEYNKNWNYFAGLSPEEAALRAADEESGASAFRKSAHWAWGGPGDGSRSRDEMRALDALELESDADFTAVKRAHRRLVKETHPDANPGNEEAARRAAEEESGAKGFRQSAQWQWAGPGDGSRSRDEMRALDALELDSDADFKAVKAAHRRLVKETHPDANPGDEDAAKRFKQIQAAYDVLKRSEERNNGKAS